MAQPQSQAPVTVNVPSNAPTPNPAYSHPHAPSPAQQSPSPAQSNPQFPLPASKRPRLSPGADSPLPAGSPGASGAATPTPTSASAAPSPQQYQSISLPTSMPNPTPASAATSPAPYTNGNPASLHLPNQQAPFPSPTVATPQLATPSPTTTSAPYTTATMVPMPSSSTPVQAIASPATPGAMGPPSRPPDRPAKETDYEPDDLLAGTGIDLQAEERFTADLLYGPEARQGFAQYPPGDRGSFYGAGPMNQPVQTTSAKTQEQLAAETAEQAWRDASQQLAQTRVRELNNPFIQIPRVHARATKIAREHGLGLNLEIKKDGTGLGRMRNPDEQEPPPTVTVQTKKLPDSTVVHTYGSLIPHDAYLVDQLALLSIACKARLRSLLEDAQRYSFHRRTMTHGEIPNEWQDVATPPKGYEEVVAAQERENQQQETAASDGAAGDGTNPLKRPQDAANLDQSSKPRPKMAKLEKNTLIETMRDGAKKERDWEEIRLRKRQARKDGTPDQGTTSRAGSVAPGTPGSVAPEPGAKKDGTSKKDRKSAAARAAEASSSHANQNQTTALFMGNLGTGSLFGKKKKSYNWMSKGAGSGASTPLRPGTPGPAGAATPSAPAEPAPLTTEGRNRLGLWREDGEKGRGIQIRDWMAALEAEGLDKAALHHIYNRLDTYGPK